ncbi:MAG TPA: hypothetical protein VNZ86_06110 [Bacteroidia bacterium]|jgi:hypothetical protein|nr:hypothetical protein [Bacteroidia bacterium]
MKKFLGFCIASGILFSACKTDFKLTSTWKEQMVIFGLLNQSDTVQYIRINKTFLGDGNAYSMAQVNDSINYKYMLNVKLEKWTLGGGALVNTFVIDTTSSIAQTNTPFANSPTLLYRVHTGIANPLSSDYEYHLTVVNPVTGYTAKAMTPLVVGYDSNNTHQNGISLNLITPDPIFTSAYNFYNTSIPFKIHWQTSTNGRIYNPVLRIHYTEYDLSSVGTNKYVDKDFGNYTSQSTLGGEDQYASMSWDEFRYFIPAAMGSSAGVSKRVITSCEFLMYVGGDEFNTYMEVNMPVSSITGEKPTYTNILNGIGLFSTRYTYDPHRLNKPLTNTTLDNLATDPVSCPAKIADHNGIVYTCP